MPFPQLSAHVKRQNRHPKQEFLSKKQLKTLNSKKISQQAREDFNIEQQRRARTLPFSMSRRPYITLFLPLFVNHKENHKLSRADQLLVSMRDLQTIPRSSHWMHAGIPNPHYVPGEETPYWAALRLGCILEPGQQKDLLKLVQDLRNVSILILSINMQAN